MTARQPGQRAMKVAALGLLLASTLTACGGGGGGGDSGSGSTTPTGGGSSTATVDQARLASSIQMIVATYVGGSGGAAGKTLTGTYRVGDTLPCSGGGTITVTSTVNSTSNAQYALRQCVLAMASGVTYTGIAPGSGDLSSFGPLAGQGTAMGLSVQATFTSGGVEGNANPQASTAVYSLNQNLTKNAVFTLGSGSRYVTSSASLQGTQTGAGAGAQFSLSVVYGTFQYGGRELRYSTVSALTWGAGGPSGGTLAVTDNTTTVATDKLRNYIFSSDGTVRVTDATNVEIGSFAYGGVAFQQALAAAAQ